jgi:hypothetical protein
LGWKRGKAVKEQAMKLSRKLFLVEFQFANSLTKTTNKCSEKQSKSPLGRLAECLGTKDTKMALT